MERRQEVRRDPQNRRRSSIESARLRKGAYHCYLELHIEQGGTLDEGGVPIGVVDGIVAIDRYDVEIRGFANHAGTTPMPARRDALIAASHLTIAVARSSGARLAGRWGPSDNST